MDCKIYVVILFNTVKYIHLKSHKLLFFKNLKYYYIIKLIVKCTWFSF